VLQMTLGVEISGTRVTPAEVKHDNTFEAVPIAHAAGVPLYAKRLFDRRPYPNSGLYVAVRLMSEPAIGFAPNDWQYGGALGPCPIVHLVRSDGVPFTVSDWCVMDDFCDGMLSDGPRAVTPSHWRKFCQARWEPGTESNCLIEVMYPKGATVTVHGLKSRPELNGKEAVLVGMQGGRVGAKFDDSDGPLALKPENVTVVQRK